MNNNLPTVVRLVRFPQTYKLARKGRQYIGPLRRSGPVVHSDRHGAIDCTFRVTAPGVTFSTGNTSITVTEAFEEGEQRDLHVPWGLMVDANVRPPLIAIEIDLKYADEQEFHTATAPLKLAYGMSAGRKAGVAAAAVAAAAVGVAVAKRKKNVVVDDEDDVELALFNIASTKRAPAKAGTRPAKGSKVTVVDEDDAEVAVYNTGRRASSSKKTSKKTSKKSVKKAAPAKKSSQKTAAKKSTTKKSAAKKSTTKKAASKKQAGGSRRGSGASRSAPRKGARGSSSARKSASRRTTRKSR